MRTRTLDWIALTLTIIGALNWGLFGFFGFDLVVMLFGGINAWASRTVYAVIGIAGLYCLSIYARINDTDISRE